MSPNQSLQFSTWDAKRLLKIENEDKQYEFTCVGHIKNKKRRCLRGLASHNKAAAVDILTELPQIFQNRELLERRLQKLAKLALCRKDHQYQVYEIASQWYETFVTELNRRISILPSPRDDNSSRTSLSPPRSSRNPSTSQNHPRSESVMEVQHNPAQHNEENGSKKNAGSDSAISTSEDNACPICYRVFIAFYRTPCGHKFCWECISKWLKDGVSKVCPMDRRQLRLTDLVFVSESDTLCVPAPGDKGETGKERKQCRANDAFRS